MSNSQFRLIDINETILLILPPSCTIFFNGILNMEVLLGEINVLGCKLTRRSNAVNVVSCRGTSLIGISTGPPHIQSHELDLPLEVADKSLQINSSDVVVLLSKVSVKPFIDYLKRYIRFPLFMNMNEFSLAIEKTLNCHFQTEETTFKRIIIPENWECIWKSMHMFMEDFGEIPRTVICGGNGVGKSTLLRYMINQTLNVQQQVLVLDFDPGQAEFTVMGCISAVLVKLPLLGPNFSHLTTPLRSLYLGDISVADNLKLYYSYVKNIIDYSRLEEYKNLPLFVNTMGFTKGLGPQIISQIIQYLSPTNVIQIYSPRRSCNFPQILEAYNVKKYPISSHSDNSSLKYTVHYIPSVSENDTAHGSTAPWGMNAALKRDVVTLSYFWKAFNSTDKYFTDLIPYKICLEGFELAIYGETFERAEILKAMAGNMVALCYKDADKNELVLNVGFGIVRGIDIEHDVMYIITPVTVEQLKQVKLITMNKRINLPLSVYAEQLENIICEEICYIMEQDDQHLNIPNPFSINDLRQSSQTNQFLVSSSLSNV